MPHARVLQPVNPSRAPCFAPPSASRRTWPTASPSTAAIAASSGRARGAAGRARLVPSTPTTLSPATNGKQTWSSHSTPPVVSRASGSRWSTRSATASSAGRGRRGASGRPPATAFQAPSSRISAHGAPAGATRSGRERHRARRRSSAVVAAAREHPRRSRPSTSLDAPVPAGPGATAADTCRLDCAIFLHSIADLAPLHRRAPAPFHRTDRSTPSRSPPGRRRRPQTGGAPPSARRDRDV